MTIVCGTDLSAAATPAVLAASALAQVTREPLWLAHVLPSGAAASDARWAAASTRLEEEAAGLRAQVAAGVRSEVLSGSPDDALLAFAAERRASLVIVGSKGHAMEHLLVPSGTSERLAHASPVPVLVVRDAAPFRAWARGERPLRVVVGVDDSVSCEGAIAWIAALRRAAPCDVVVGHVYYPFDAWARYGMRGRQSLVTPDSELEALIARDLRARVGELPGSGEVTYRPKLGMGRAADHLLELAETEKADLVVVGARRHRGFGRLWSVSSGVVHLSKVAVARIPAAPSAPARVGLPNLERVLIATDLSPQSSAAVPYGYALLGDEGGEVFLLHVLGPRSPAEQLASAVLPSSGGEVEEAQLEVDVAARLRSVVPEAAHRRGIVSRTLVKWGHVPAEVICETAEQLGADVICLGSHGRSGLSRAVFGSVTEAVLKQARRPVLVVRTTP